MVNVYMSAEGIEGEARGDDRENFVTGIGLEYSLDRAMERTPQGEAVGGLVNTGLIRMTKFMCFASPTIMKAISHNISFELIEFFVAVEDAEEEIDQLHIEASNCKFMEYRVANDGSDPQKTQMLETIGVFYESAVFYYTPLSRSPKAGEGPAEFEHYVDPNTRA